MNRHNLYQFYDVQNDDDLITRMEQHIEKLIERVSKLEAKERVRTNVREG